MYRSYPDYVVQNKPVIDHLVVDVMNNELAWKIPRKEMSQFSNYFRGRIKDRTEQRNYEYKGHKYSLCSEPFYLGQIGNKPNVSFSTEFTEKNFIENAVFHAYNGFRLHLILNLQRNIRRRHSETLNWNSDFDEQVRIHNDNYVSPEVVCSDIIACEKLEIPDMEKIFSSVTEMLLGRVFSADLQVVRQIEVTQDYTVPNFSALSVMAQFKRFLTTDSGIEWMQQRGFFYQSMVATFPRGDNSVKLSHPKFDFKVYAKTKAHVRTEIKVVQENVFKDFCGTRDLRQLEKIFGVFSRVLQELDFFSLFDSEFSCSDVGDKYSMKRSSFLGNLPDILTAGRYGQIIGLLAGRGYVSEALLYPFLKMNPTLERVLERFVDGRSVFYRLPRGHSQHKICFVCRTPHLIGEMYCRRCGSSRWEIVEDAPFPKGYLGDPVTEMYKEYQVTVGIVKNRFREEKRFNSHRSDRVAGLPAGE